jgi:poly(A)-specific ribonuclease
MEFVPLQFGLCPFTWDSELQQWTAKPFNIYLFPLTSRVFGHDRSFSLQASTVEFLLENGFDFNKCFEQGVSFMTPLQESRLRAKHAARANQNSERAEVLVKEENAEFVANAL